MADWSVGHDRYPPSAVDGNIWAVDTTESRRPQRGDHAPSQDDDHDRVDAQPDTGDAAEPWSDEELSCLLRPQAG
jgi:hypothetical protein